MKKLIFILLLLLAVFPVSAIDMNTGVQTAAAYFPADTKVFAAFRTDEAFIDELDLIINTVRTQLPAEMGMPGLRDSLRQSLASAPVDFDTLLAWVGDWAAFGVTGEIAETTAADGYFVIHLEDEAGFKAYLTENAEEFNITVEGENVFIAGDSTRFEFKDGLLYSTRPGYTLPEVSESLLDSASFQQSIGALPADSYNVVFYTDLSAAMAAADDAQLETLGLNSDSLGHLGLGFTILDGRTFTVDAAQTDVASEATAISSDFARFIPAQSSAFIQATDFTALFNGFVALAQQSASEGNDPLEQIEQGLQTLGIDLQEDILSWTTGDYALILRTDIAGGLGNMESAMGDPLQYADFGIIFEATDPAKAQELATRLNSLITMVGGNNPDMTVTTETLSGTEVTVISAPVQPGLNLELAIGANDEVFFVATRRAATVLLSGESPISANTVYQAASQYFLPNATTVWYADGNGLAASMLGPLVLLGPAIGNVYDNILDDLENPSSSQSQPQTMTISNRSQQAEDIEIFMRVLGLLHSGSITSNVVNGTRLVRATLTLNLE